MFKLASKRDKMGRMLEFSSTKDAGLLPYFTPDQIPNLRAWFEAGGSGTTWIDARGGAGNGTLNGATWGASGVNFSGSNQYVDGFANSISPKPSGAITGRTFSIWATNSDSSFARRGMIGTRDSGANGVFFGYRDSTSIFYANIGGSNWTPTVAMPAVNTRNFWALTHAGNTITLYLNGAQIAQTTAGVGTENASSYTGRIGGEQQGSSTENWQGSIDRVLTYTRALSAAEITQLATLA